MAATATRRTGNAAGATPLSSTTTSASPPSTSSSTTAAINTAVDAYANLILRLYSPPQNCIDSSLGPYVCSILRSHREENEHSNIIPEFDSLLELLEEHCGMSDEMAREALEMIHVSVRTGIVDEDFVRRANMNRGNSWRAGDDQFEAVQILSRMMREVSVEGVANVGYTASSSSDEDIDNAGHGNTLSSGFETEENGDSAVIMDGSAQNNLPVTPMKACALIPADLLAVMDDPSSPNPQGHLFSDKTTTALPQSYDQNIPEHITEDDDKEKPSPSPPTEKQHQEEKLQQQSSSKSLTAQELTAALFRPARSRSNSVAPPSEKSPPTRPQSSTAVTNPNSILPLHLNNCTTSSTAPNYLIDSAVEILLSLNADLSEEAALAAAFLSNADANIAQYVIEGATSAPPVCRHMLNDGCYRSDCQFSHDVEGHTCLFWLRGRCGKGSKCRFLHGFHERLLDGITLPKWSGVKQHHATSVAPITTANLVERNRMVVTSTTPSGNNPFSFLNSPKSPWNEGFDPATATSWSSSSFSHPPQTPAQPPSSPPSFSFASVASKGYDRTSFATKDLSQPNNPIDATNQSKSSPKYVKIPPDLWNPNYNRSAALFNIPDPIQRFHEVNNYPQSRPDIMDLHFQSIKTFPVVLSKILPTRLKQCKDSSSGGGVWIVTGSGHHVNKNSHQKSGGVLEKAVQSWLLEKGYVFYPGRDRLGYGGAVLVKGLSD